MRIAEFNRLGDEEATRLLLNCCGSSRWVEGMLAGRPYPGMAVLMGRAEREWRDTLPADWQEAFSHHARIGETTATAPVSEAARRWSAAEQGGLRFADAALRRALADANRDYEQHFGRIYIVCANGRGAEELLQNLRDRMSNSPEDELTIAAREQGSITRQRLQRLFSEEETADS